MRVLHTIDSVDPRHGGPSRTVPALVAALRASGVDADLFAWKDGRKWPRSAPDLIHDHGIWLPSNHRTARIARRSQTPRVVSTRGMLEPWAVRHRRWKKRLAWRLFQRADLRSARAIHVTSEAEAAGVRSAGITSPITTIPNAVDLPPDLPPRAPAAARRRALSLCRLHPVKGLPLLISAWARVRPSGWELVIAGPDTGNHRHELERLICELGLGADVHVRGAVADDAKWALYRSADVFILPTLSENFGLVVAEALAAELPVITTRGAPWSVLPERRCGWWTGIDADAIAGALREATSAPREQLVRMGERGRALVAQCYSWTGVACAMAEFYDSVLGAARGRAP